MSNTEPVEVAPRIDAGSDATPEAQLTAALANAQAEFPVIAKTQTATVPTKTGGSYSYTYADLADVLSAVRPVLARNGLALTQPTITREGKSVLLTIVRHVGGATLESEVDLGQQPSNPQNFGGALTYLRRYELCTLLGIAAEDDTDAQNVKPAGRVSEPEPLPVWARPTERSAEWVNALAPLIGREQAIALGTNLSDAWGYVPDGAIAIAKAITGALNTALPESVRDVLEAEHAHAAAEAPDAPAPEPEGDEAPVEEVPPAQDATVAPASVLSDTDALDKMSPQEASATLRSLGCICQNPAAGPHLDACPIIGHGIAF